MLFDFLDQRKGIRHREMSAGQNGTSYLAIVLADPADHLGTDVTIDMELVTQDERPRRAVRFDVR